VYRGGIKKNSKKEVNRRASMTGDIGGVKTGKKNKHRGVGGKEVVPLWM